MLIDDIQDRIAPCLSARAYYPCVLLVHTRLDQLQDAAQQLAERTGWRRLPVSRLLADALIEQPPARRSTLAGTALDSALAQLRPGPLICTDLVLLFEPSLALDPLALLRQWSRRLPVVACWPGAYSEEGLAYAVAEHGHYRLWRKTGLEARCIILL